MIRSVAELLQALVEKEAPLLASFSEIRHPTLIGDMYEGLTKDLLEKSVFEGLDLRVVDGKIANQTGELSGQIDCMVVVGDGKAIPYTTSYIYPLKSVLAVIEVKKNLYSSEMGDAHRNLLTVGANVDSDEYKAVRSAFWSITGEDIPEDDPEALTPQRKLMFSHLARDVRTPIRVILGYLGFKTESSFQAAVSNYLEASCGIPGFGPASLPNLIVCEQNAVVKLNGMPYSAAVLDGTLGIPNFRPEDWWPLYASRNGVSLLLLLELLWTRLRWHFAVPVTIFGEDLEVENLNCFLFAKAHPGKGWEYYFYPRPESVLRASPSHIDWEPHALEEPEFLAFSMLAAGKDITLSDPDLLAFLLGAGRALDDFVKRMTSTRLVQVDARGRLVPLAESMIIGVSPKGEYFVDRADSPRAVHWALKRRSGHDA